MAQLKPAFIAEIKHALDEKAFTVNDFEIDLPDSGPLLVKIHFQHQPNYILECKEVSKRENYSIEQAVFQTLNETREYTVYEISLCPGQYKTLEEKELSDLGDLISLIPKWSESIHADMMVSVPKDDRLEELREKFTRDIEENITDPDDFFTEEEQQRIDEKFAKLLKQLEKLEEEQKLTKDQLEQIECEFNEYRSNSSYFPKGTWAKITSNRLLKTIGRWANTPEGRNLIIDEIKRLFLGN